MNERSALLRWNIIEKYIPQGGVGAEIGVFKGHLSSYFLKKSLKKIYLVDPWYRLSPTWNWVKNQDNSTLSAFNNIIKIFEKEINAGVVVPVVDFSVPFLSGIKPHSLDFVYLDSSHSYEDTIQELEACQISLKENGILLGDDWHDNESHRHYGVAKAVKEYIEKGVYEPLFDPVYEQWGLIKKKE